MDRRTLSAPSSPPPLPVVIGRRHSRAASRRWRRAGRPSAEGRIDRRHVPRCQAECTHTCIHTSMAAPTRLPRAARRAQLIEAAASAFLGRGFEKTSMEDVAQAAGVSRLIVYRNFESKEDLYRAVLRQLLVDLGEAFSGLSFEDVAERGAATVDAPGRPGPPRRVPPAVARRLAPAVVRRPRRGVPDVRHGLRAGHPQRRSSPTRSRLDWAARSAGAHLVDGICNWLDAGDPARDDELAGGDVGRPAQPGRGVVGRARAQPAPADAASTSTMRSICSSVVTSGGQNVSVSVPIARVITPPASIRSRIAMAS